MTGKNLLKKYKIILIFIFIIFLSFLSIYGYLGYPPNKSLGSADSYSELFRSDNILNGNPQSVLDRPFLVPTLPIPLGAITGLGLILSSKIIYLAVYYLVIAFLFLKIKPKKVAILSAIILAIVPYFIFMSLEMERAPIIAFLFLIALYFLKKYSEEECLIDYITSLILLGIITLVHVTSYFFMATFFIIILTFKKNRIKNLLYFLIIIALFFSVLPITQFLFGEPQISETVKIATKGFLINLRGGFSEIGAENYFVSLNGWLTFPVFLLSILGITFTFIYKKYKTDLFLKSLLIWTVLIYFLFGIQYNSFSHSSRYPFYLILPLVFFSAYYVIGMNKKFSRYSRITLIFIFITLAFLGFYSQDLTYYRDRWEPHEQICNFLIEGNLVNENNQILYIGWPSIKHYCGKSIPLKYHHFFGWNSVNLTEINEDFISKNNISYYIYDHTGSDYYSSSEIVFLNINKSRDIELIEKFSNELRSHFYVELYKIHKF